MSDNKNVDNPSTREKSEVSDPNIAVSSREVSSVAGSVKTGKVNVLKYYLKFKDIVHRKIVKSHVQSKHCNKDIWTVFRPILACLRLPRGKSSSKELRNASRMQHWCRSASKNIEKQLQSCWGSHSVSYFTTIRVHIYFH